MKTALACVLIALAVQNVLAEPLLGRNLMDARSRTSAEADSTTGTSTRVGASATSTGGSVSIAAKAFAEASAESKRSIASAVSDAFSKVGRGETVSAAADAAAAAIATAIATAYAEVQVEIVSTGEDNVACADAEATAEAAALAYAKAFAEAVAIAEQENDVSVAVVDSTAIAAATAHAFAQASADVCLYGVGRANAFHSSLADSIVTVYAAATAEALAAFTPSGVKIAEVDAHAVSETKKEETFAETGGEASIDGDGHSITDGIADASTRQVELCKESPFVAHCCSGGRRLCRCGPRCLATFDSRTNTFSLRRRYRDYPAGFTCLCL